MTQLFPSETRKLRIVSKNKLQNKIQIRNSKSIREKLCQSHLRTVIPPIDTWEQLCHCHLRTIVPISLENNSANVTWVQLHQSYLGIIVQTSLGTIVLVQLGKTCAEVAWE